MDNLNNPFGIPSPGQPVNQPGNTDKTNTPTNSDQSAKSNTVIESLRLQKEDEERAKKQYKRELDGHINKYRRLIQKEDLRIAKEYGTYSLGGFFFGGVIGFVFGKN